MSKPAKEERSFQAVPEAEKKQSYHVWRTAAFPGRQDGGGDLRCSVTDGDDSELCDGLRISFDYGTWPAAREHTLDGHRHYVLDMAFSPDGRLRRHRRRDDRSSLGRGHRKASRGVARRIADRRQPPPPFRAMAAFWRSPFPTARFKSGKWRRGPSGTNSRATAIGRPL